MIVTDLWWRDQTRSFYVTIDGSGSVPGSGIAKSRSEVASAVSLMRTSSTNERGRLDDKHA